MQAALVMPTPMAPGAATNDAAATTPSTISSTTVPATTAPAAAPSASSTTSKASTSPSQAMAATTHSLPSTTSSPAGTLSRGSAAADNRARPATNIGTVFLSPLSSNGSNGYGGNSTSAPPPIVALFVVRFDVRRGYVTDWQRTSSPSIPMSMIEFKVFPSGLHNFTHDVIYFTHGELYSGVSVYMRQSTDNAAERFSRMYSLGILVPSGFTNVGGAAGRSSAAGGRAAVTAGGRLGRSWGHVEGLTQLLQEYARNPGDYSPLEGYFSLYGLTSMDASPMSPSTVSSLPEPALYRPARRPFPLNPSKLKDITNAQVTVPAAVPGTAAAAATTALADTDTDSLAGQTSTKFSAPMVLPRAHPAYSLPSFLDTFGPLVFKVWKAALTRQRILIVGDIPIEQGCNFVYDIAILSNIPNSISELLPIPAYRIRPLFSVGLYDIDYLKSLCQGTPAEEARQKRPSAFYGWIAYTTDKLLQEKQDLYDVIIKLPPLAALMYAAASAAITVPRSRASSPQSMGGASANQSQYMSEDAAVGARIVYPVVYFTANTKVHLRASSRDMRRFQALEAQIGYSVDPRHRWYQKYYGNMLEAEAEELVQLDRRISSSSGSTTEFSGRIGRRGEALQQTSERLALLAAAEGITAAAESDAIYNEDPELFFSTKTDLQTEQPSWKQLTWLGFLWWASAGEEARIDEEDTPDVVAQGLDNNGTSTSLDQGVLGVGSMGGIGGMGTGLGRGSGGGFIGGGLSRPLLADDSVSRSSSVATTPMALSNEESFTYISPFEDITQLDEAFVRRSAAARALRREMSEDDEEEDEERVAVGMIAAAVESSKQVAIIAFFHRFTARIFSALARLVEEQRIVVTKVERQRRRRQQQQEVAEKAGEQRQTLWISKVDMLAMGLDPWSESDSQFVGVLVERWWGGQVEARRDNEFLNSVTFCC
ncbi:uncharacterized protein V1518DRAFT_417531 [Limtongia smithiae]|uniref:uncharacterized protein n=1 Tax=Limtongia smithiae TaxID=1125753 RepID=UPI0034CEBA5D